MKSERENDGRRSKLKALLKDKGTFGKTVLKNFDKMKFENESEFDDFYDGVVEDLAAIDQERANEGLENLVLLRLREILRRKRLRLSRAMRLMSLPKQCNL